MTNMGPNPNKVIPTSLNVGNLNILEHNAVIPPIIKNIIQSITYKPKIMTRNIKIPLEGILRLILLIDSRNSFLHLLNTKNGK